MELSSGDVEMLRQSVIGAAAVTRAQLRMEGMKAENEQRRVSGASPAYVMKDFEAVIGEEDIGYNSMLQRFFF